MIREDLYATEWARSILVALQRKHVYGMTVSDQEKQRRRAVNRRARIGRRNNRG